VQVQYSLISALDTQKEVKAVCDDLGIRYVFRSGLGTSVATTITVPHLVTTRTLSSASPYSQIRLRKFLLCRLVVALLGRNTKVCDRRKGENLSGANSINLVLRETQRQGLEGNLASSLSNHLPYELVHSSSLELAGSRTWSTPASLYWT
jgi:hypothetical protein